MNETSVRTGLFIEGSAQLHLFCEHNGIVAPDIVQVERGHHYYNLGTCAFYRHRAIDAKVPTVWIMVDKCALRGYEGRNWSWPGYVVDRTPWGVLLHELGHHVDHVASDITQESFEKGLYSYQVYQYSKEKQITGYLGTDSQPATFYKEWFAEIFRLFAGNPDLCRVLRPRFFEFVSRRFKPLSAKPWREVIANAPQRILAQAEKKIAEAQGKTPAAEGSLFG